MIARLRLFVASVLVQLARLVAPPEPVARPLLEEPEVEPEPEADATAAFIEDLAVSAELRRHFPGLETDRAIRLAITNSSAPLQSSADVH